MSRVLFEVCEPAAIYRVILTQGGRLLVQELIAGKQRSYRITHERYKVILDSVDQPKAAKAEYHRARLKRKARRRAKGEGLGVMVPVAQKLN